MRLRTLRWRLSAWRRFGVIWCQACHHRWRRHYAHAFRCNHPLDPEEWDVDYGCEGCDRTESDCELVSWKDEAGALKHRR